MAIREFTLCELQQIADGRWFLEKDMNCDGASTISDANLWFEWVFFLPGDGLYWLLMQSQQLSAFLELTGDAYGGWDSGIFSAMAWLIALIIWGVVAALLEDWKIRR